jgi:FkbM family methyltransferase
VPRIILACGAFLCALAAFEASLTATPLLASSVTGLLGAGLVVAGVRQRRNSADQASRVKDASHRARTRVSEVTKRLDEMKTRLGVLHHAIPEPLVLEGMLPIRARTAASLARRASVVDREARFRAASPAYAAELAVSPPPDRTRRMSLQGLRWWMPITRPQDVERIERYTTHQDFPYRALAQTREVSVGGAMLDIGANVGRMSLPRVVLGDVRVAYCAEPEPLNYSCLVRNIVDNGLAGLVLPDRLAIGAENGVVRLQLARSAGGHRVLDEGEKSRRSTVEVPCLTLDTWVDRIGVDLDELSFVKVDAQGSEMDVLRGARGVLAHRHIAWQIEVDLATLAHRGVSAQDLYAELAQHFTHVIDLSRHVGGPRMRPIAQIGDALSYLSGPDGGRTDVLFVTLEESAGQESASITAAASSGISIS